MGTELLDHAEDVVPAAGVQAGGVLAQLEQDLVHLEGGQDDSIRTVARTEPCGMPSAAWAATKTSFHRCASRWLSSFGR
jgi:hypothetical protein